MSDYGPPAGFGLRRNGTCTEKEKQCSHPWGDWYNCCPEGTYCSDDNTCCPTTAGCSNYIKQDPHCANNATWDLYESDESYFCCLSTSHGFLATGLVYNGTATTGVGCSDGLPDGETNTALIPIARGNASESASSSSAIPSPTTGAANTTSPSTTPTPSDTSSDGSSTNKGAIAGGVVGGVAGAALILALVWFLMRRRKQAGVQQNNAQMSYADPTKQHAGFYGGELADSPARAELSGNANSYAHELPADAYR
ncbi:hypothetical protein BDV18DRAFT_8314 [Aspergillus unguis]